MYETNEDEGRYLKKIVMYTRREYLRKNKYIFIEKEDIDEVDEKMLVSIDNVEISFEIKSEKEIIAPKIEDVFRDEKITKIVKALTLREKLVLFLYYFEDKNDREIGKSLKIKQNTVQKTRKRALEKIQTRYFEMEGDDFNV
ncbi:MAG: sigma-70 family RNA polymerase sigma factor [Clostridia bacterium]|nr:sigma-70 family RNA polymerase sigma factor [Clostridia bacterium]MBP3596572.1 sigma-70 family RNA polymerase sigma factor [Clostridia bacterium]